MLQKMILTLLYQYSVILSQNMKNQRDKYNKSNNLASLVLITLSMCLNKLDILFTEFQLKKDRVELQLSEQIVREEKQLSDFMLVAVKNMLKNQ